MRGKKLFYGVWLVFGLFQLALVRDAGAATTIILQSSNATQTDPNSDATGGSSASNAAGNASPSASTTAGTTASAPVRVSRALFENASSLTSNTQISIQDASRANSPSSSTKTYTSDVHWSEDQVQAGPVNLVGPQPIASYNNHVGCAEITSISPLQLCFTIQSDVSSLTLSPDQMSLAGLQSIVDTDCISQTKFVSASKNKDNSGFTVQYQLIENSDPRCAGKGGTLVLSIQSSQAFRGGPGGNTGSNSSFIAT